MEQLCDFCSIFCSVALDEIATEVICSLAVCVAGPSSSAEGGFCALALGEKVTPMGGVLEGLCVL